MSIIKPIIFVTRDPYLNVELDKASEILRAEGWKVIRGPDPTPGTPFRFSPDQRRELISNVDIIVASSRTRLVAEDLDASSRLRAVAFPSIGVDAVDLVECAKRGIIVANGATPENFLAMAEATVMLMLVLLYRLHTSELLLRGNHARPDKMYARMMRNRQVGLVGLGQIGRSVVKRLAGWQAEIVVHDPYLEPSSCPDSVRLVDLEELLKSSDLVSLHVPLNDQTRNMVSEPELRAMKTDAILINTSRGGLIDEEALVSLMEEGHLAGVGLDVFATEPLPADHPLRKFDRAILTPHILGHTKDLYDVIPDVLVENVKRMMRGELPLYTRNPDVENSWKSLVERLSI